VVEKGLGSSLGIRRFSGSETTIFTDRTRSSGDRTRPVHSSGAR
jgi:hypothetical protein